MADKEKKGFDDIDNNKIYKDLKSKEMLSKVKDKIESSDPQILKTLRTFLKDDGDGKKGSK